MKMLHLNMYDLILYFTSGKQNQLKIKMQQQLINVLIMKTSQGFHD